MPKDKTISHDKIVNAAMHEFLEKGYENVTMRQIAHIVGLTQSALYRHYPSKEDMFCSLLEPLMNRIKELSEIHTKNAYNSFDSGNDVNEMFKDNSVSILKQLLPEYRDQLKLVLCCSRGTKYENFIHQLVEYEQEGTYEAIKYLKDHGKVIGEINKKELHLLLSAYITAIFEPIVHDWSDEETLHGLEKVEEFFIPGWKHLMGD